MKDAVLVYDSSNSCMEDMSVGSIFVDLPVHNASHNFSQHIQASGTGELVHLPRANPDEYESVVSHGEKGSVDNHGEKGSVDSHGEMGFVDSHGEKDSVFRPCVAGHGEYDSMVSPSELILLTSPSRQKAMTSNGKDAPLPNHGQHDTISTLSDSALLTNHVPEPLTGQDDLGAVENITLACLDQHDHIYSDNQQLVNTDYIGVVSPFLTLAKKSVNEVDTSIVITAAELDTINGNNKAMCVYCNKLIKSGNIVNHMKNVHNKTTKNTKKISSDKSKLKNNPYSCDSCDYKTTKEINCMDTYKNIVFFVLFSGQDFN